MFREVIRKVMCQFLGRPVEIRELYQVEGTATCQVEVSPFYWECGESRNCGASQCQLRNEYFLLKNGLGGD